MGTLIEGSCSFHCSSEKQHGMMKEKFARRQDLNFGSLLLAVWEKVMAPTPVLLPGKSHGQRSLVGCSPWGR